jgi:ubiquinone/menaquinone biosynthesis C-methylase UbiE
MDYNEETTRSFDAGAGRYAEKYFGLRNYDAHYDSFLRTLPSDDLSFLDLACGPGSVAAYIRARRPRARIVCADRSLAMLAEAAARVPDVSIVQVDCRDLGAIDERFHGVAFCFGMNYLDDDDAPRTLSQARSKLRDQGSLLLASVAGDARETVVHFTADGSRVLHFSRPPETIVDMVVGAGFDLLSCSTIPSPEHAPVRTTDVVLIARRTS